MPDRTQVQPQSEPPGLVQQAQSQGQRYDSEQDWINQKKLAELLGVVPETASRWAKEGKLRIFQHGMVGAGKRKYSRRLVLEYQQLRLEQARSRMRQALQIGDPLDA